MTRARIDHLVVAGASLADCVQWCEATLGVSPGAGGRHPLMGTHNRLLDLSSTAHPRCYLELIAVEPGVAPTRAPGLRRWFDLDDEGLQASLRVEGPRLIHFVARVADAQATVDSLAQETPPVNRGAVIQATRDSPAGRLEWHISVRDDGQRLMQGLLPTVIQWGNLHPTGTMPPSGLTLERLVARHPQATPLAANLACIGLHDVETQPGPPLLTAWLQTPRGPVSLCSDGI